MDGMRIHVRSVGVMIKGPCKDCVDRYIGCHGTCEKYIQFKIDLENDNEKIKTCKEKSSRAKERVARTSNRVSHSPIKCHKK